jgi:hypothetical protein
VNLAPYGIMTLSLKYGAVLTGAMLVVGGAIGFLVGGAPGLVSALIGAGLTAVFMGFTAGSILLAARLTKGDGLNPLFYGVVLGVWALKIIVFFVIMLGLSTVAWLDARILFGSVIVAVAGSLIVDLVAFARARVPYASNVELPGGQ